MGKLVLSSPRGPFRNYRRKSTDLKMSWSTKRRNSRPSLTNSTRPSPRCPATKKKSSIILQISQFFSFANFLFSRFFYHQISKFCSTTFLYVFPPPIPKTFQKKKTKSFSSVTVVFGCDDIFLCEKL